MKLFVCLLDLGFTPNYLIFQIYCSGLGFKRFLHVWYCLSSVREIELWLTCSVWFGQNGKTLLRSVTTSWVLPSVTSSNGHSTYLFTNVDILRETFCILRIAIAPGTWNFQNQTFQTQSSVWKINLQHLKIIFYLHCVQLIEMPLSADFELNTLFSRIRPNCC